MEPTVRESLLYEDRPGQRVKCGVCERRCNLAPGQVGACRTMKNIDGKLFTLVYGDISSIESRPIEIKPFFHYWPGSTALTFATWSCNLDCQWCQNYHLSKVAPNPAKANYYSPQRVVDIAIAADDEGVCGSFQEPTLLTDWVIEVFRIARDKGLYSCFVSNGYMTLEALRLLRESGLDGLKIDLKGDRESYGRYCGGVDVEVVWRNAHDAKAMGLHVEIVNLVVTGVNDDEECLRWVVDRHLKAVGPETPLHFTKYYPAYKFHNPPTKVKTLEKAYGIARDGGVLFPYLGNVRGHPYENTYCPGCRTALIKRLDYLILRYNIGPDRKCPKCGYNIPITGRYVRKLTGFPFG